MGQMYVVRPKLIKGYSESIFALVNVAIIAL